MKRVMLLVVLLLFLAGCTEAPPAPLPVVLTPTSPIADSSPNAGLPAPTTTGQAELSTGGPINPLTGQAVADPSALNRRPVMIKIQNLPRPRQQWGTTLADIVYEYYTELGSTRFAAVYYGNNSERVGPIRSARWADIHLIQMYKPLFVFGSAYKELLDTLLDAEFAPQMLLEQPDSCPSICRYDPDGKNFLMADTNALQGYAARLGMDNAPQELSGMVFSSQAPEGGKEAGRVYARFSGAIYNRWDYDAASGRYLRFSDQQDDSKWETEVYEPLMDLQTGQQVGAENVVVILAEYITISKTDESEVFDIDLTGSGMAYAARDGKLYNLTWKREAESELLSLWDDQGEPFPLKPGQTWYEVMGYSSSIDLQPDGWRFTFFIP